MGDNIVATPMGSVRYGEEKVTGRTGVLVDAGTATLDYNEASLGVRWTDYSQSNVAYYFGVHADYVSVDDTTVLTDGFDPNGLSGRLEIGGDIAISDTGNLSAGFEFGGIGSELAEVNGHVKFSFKF